MKIFDFHKILALTLSFVLIIIVMFSNLGTACFSLAEIISSYAILLYNIIIIIVEEFN